jgi:hypothetical protein
MRLWHSLLKSFCCKVVQVTLRFAWQATWHMAIRRSEKKGGLIDGTLAPKESTWSIWKLKRPWTFIFKISPALQMPTNKEE